MEMEKVESESSSEGEGGITPNPSLGENIKKPLNRERMYKQRCMYNWRKTYGVSISVEEHDEFKLNKKFYLKLKELDINLIEKFISINS
jgi:hypothetical protein